jgi:glycyl-tRNA synthetase
MADNTDKTVKNYEMDDIVALCKRRGFVYPGSEIYGGEAGLYDFGPYGVELLNNIKKSWWKANVQVREDMVGLDSAMFKNPKVWEASGHVGGFADPLAECKKCNTRIRVDKELEKVGVTADEKMSEDELNNLFDISRDKIKCPKCSAKEFSVVRCLICWLNLTWATLPMTGSVQCIFLVRLAKEFILTLRTLLIQRG